jgi:hypothetical protein
MKMTRFIDVTLDKDSFDWPNGKFVGPMRELWKLAVPEPSNLHREPERMTRMKNLLLEDRVKIEFREHHHSWALLALDKAQNPQEITLRFKSPSAGRRLTLIADGREAARDLHQA